MISYRQADIFDRMRPKFVYIFQDKLTGSYDQYITGEDENNIYSKDVYHDMSYPKNNPNKPIYRRRGFVLGTAGYLDNLRNKMVYIDSQPVGVIDHIDSEGYVYAFKKDGDVVKIDPLKVLRVQNSQNYDIFLETK